MPRFTFGAMGEGELLPGEVIRSVDNPLIQREVLEAAQGTTVLPEGVLGYCRLGDGSLLVRVGDGQNAFNALPDPKVTSGGGVWGGITGTLSGQADLQAALDAKAAASHTHEYAPTGRAIATFGVLKGGGTLASDRELRLDGDTGDPLAVSVYYGTNAIGETGFHPLPESAGAGTFDGVDDVLTRPAESVGAGTHNSAGALKPAWSNGSRQRVTLTAAVTSLDRPDPIAGAPANASHTIALDFVQDATGGRTVAINADPEEGGFTVLGGLPVIGSAPGEVTTLVMETFDGGQTWLLYGTAMAASVGFDGAALGVAEATVQAALARALNATATIGAGLTGSFSVKNQGSVAVVFAGTGAANSAARSDHGHAGLVPAGGTAGQVLAKASGADHALQWVDAAEGGGSATGGQSLLGGDFSWTFDASREWLGGDFADTYE